MKEINVTDIKNFQNTIYIKNGETCIGERILYKILKKSKGRKPTYYTINNEKININITKDDIEEVVYCDFCGFQSADLEAKCPSHPKHELQYGYRLKGRKHLIYDDNTWSKLLLNKKQYPYLQGEYVLDLLKGERK